MRLILFISIYFISLSVFANEQTVSGIGGFFSQVMYFLNSIVDFFLVDLPETFNNFLVYSFAYYLKVKLYLTLWSMNFADSVAVAFLDIIAFQDSINEVIFFLPNDVQAIAREFGIFEALTIIIEALISNFVYRMFN